jgi:hypothetical protein
MVAALKRRRVKALKQGAKEGIGGGQEPKSKHRTSNIE